MRKYSSKMLLNLVFVQEGLNMSEMSMYMHWSVPCRRLYSNHDYYECYSNTS